MSAYSETTTEFKDGDLLIAALEAMGFKPTNCIGNPKPLHGVSGDYRTADGRGHTTDPNLAMKADIIIPKAQVGGAANDLGFVKGEDGKYKAIISDWDSRRYDQRWLRQVKANVAEAGVVRAATRAGMKVGSKTVVKGEVKYAFIRA